MAETQTTTIRPNKFNERFSTANRFLGPARAPNPFVNPARPEAPSREEAPERASTPVISSGRQ